MRIDNDAGDDFYRWSSPGKLQNESIVTFQEKVFSDRDTSYSFSNRDVVHQPALDDKMSSMFQDSVYPEMIASKPEVDLEVRAKVSWGGKEKTTVEAGVSASVKDDKNHAKVDVTYHDDGSTDVEVSAGRDSSGSDDRDDHPNYADQR